MLGVAALAVTQIIFRQQSIPGDYILAWTIAISWIVWHLGAGFGFLNAPPPTMYDLISGGSVGFILGERFWDGFSNILRRK